MMRYQTSGSLGCARIQSRNDATEIHVNLGSVFYLGDLNGLNNIMLHHPCFMDGHVNQIIEEALRGCLCIRYEKAVFV